MARCCYEDTFHSTQGNAQKILEKVMLQKYQKKILENRPEDALGSLVKTVETVETERRILKYLIL